MVRELSAEKRRKYLEAALKLFVANGVQHTSTAEVAREAGTASGTLFIYFPTKQDLINALVLEISKAESDAINGLLDPALPVREAFFTIWHGSVHWLLENPEVYRFSQQIRESGLIPEDVSRKTGEYFRFYYETIQRGLEAGVIKPYPVDLIGGFLYQDIAAVMNHLRLQSDPARQEESIRQGFDLFWSGISRSEGHEKQTLTADGRRGRDKIA